MDQAGGITVYGTGPAGFSSYYFNLESGLPEKVGCRSVLLFLLRTATGLHRVSPGGRFALNRAPNLYHSGLAMAHESVRYR